MPYGQFFSVANSRARSGATLASNLHRRPTKSNPRDETTLPNRGFFLVDRCYVATTFQAVIELRGWPLSFRAAAKHPFTTRKSRLEAPKSATTARISRKATSPRSINDTSRRGTVSETTVSKARRGYPRGGVVTLPLYATTVDNGDVGLTCIQARVTIMTESHQRVVTGWRSGASSRRRRGM